MRGKCLMFGITILAMVVIVACFAVTSIAYAGVNDTKTLTTPIPTVTPSPSPTSPTPPSITISINKKKVTPKEIVRIEVYDPSAEEVIVEIIRGPSDVSGKLELQKDKETWLKEFEAPNETGVYTLRVLVNDKEVGQKILKVVSKPQFSISKGPVAPNMTVDIEVCAPYAENVVIEIDGSILPLRKENETWIGEIKVPDKIGMYNLSILADGEKIGEESLEVLPIWHVFLKKYRYLLAAIVFTAIIALVFFILLQRNNREQRREKLRVRVWEGKDKSSKGAKVTVNCKKGTPKNNKKTTDDIGWAEFELPVGAWCEIEAEKKGYGFGKTEIKINRGGSEANVDLKPVEEVRKFLEVKVADEEGKKVKGARVGLLRGINPFTEGITDELGYYKLEMSAGKGQVYVFAEKEGYEKVKKPISREQPPIMLLIEIKRKLAELKLKVLDEDDEPLSDAEVKIDNVHDYYTDMSGKVKKGIEVPLGKHELRITKEGYEPYERTVNVEGDIPLEIKLKAKYGALEVKVVDEESGEPVDGIEVPVGGEIKETNKEGLVNFDKIPVETQIIEVRDPTGVYSSKPQTAEIKEKITTPSEIKLSSSFEISELKIEKLRDAYKYLEDQRERVAAYDCYLPDYYMKIGEKLIGIVSDSGKSRKLLRLVRGIHGKPTEFVEDLADVIDSACREIGKGMRERRNLEIFEDVKRFVVDKGLAKANVEVSLEDVEGEDIKKYIKRGEEGVKELLREVDQALTKIPGNIYPMSVLFKVARQIINSDTDSDDKARALVASLILEYVRVMLNDDDVEERLRGLIT